MGATNIQVAVRVRPFLPFEAGSKSCIDVLPGEDHQQQSSQQQQLSQGKSVRIGSHHANRDGHTFTFDKCFSGLASQVELYTALIVPLLTNCLEGYNATALAYGQTGAGKLLFSCFGIRRDELVHVYDILTSLKLFCNAVYEYPFSFIGKTYTTLGPATSPDFFAPQNIDKHSQEYDAVGMLPRALRDIFNQLDQKRSSLNNVDASTISSNENNNNTINGDSSHGSSDDDGGLGIPAPTKSPPPKQRPNKSNASFEYQVKLQFLELYGEEVRDLLTNPSAPQSKIIIRDSAGDAEALGATSVPVSSASEAMVCLTRGMLRRVTGATSMNAESSRSHAIMSVIIEQTTRSDSEGEGEAVIVQKSKFNFVDLAGSERQKRTNAKGQRMREGININKGLLVLGNVISALASGDKKFVPFRDSKLTRLCESW